MRIALVDASPPRKALYPLPLLKIGAWRKSLGDTCKIFMGRLPLPRRFDEIWITTRFTYDIPFALGIVREAKKRAKYIWVGGISATLLPEYFEREGVEVHRGLLSEAEKFAPDYKLLGFPPEYSISHTSRGCSRKCKFCMVSRLEPELLDRPEWPNDLCPTTKKILFYDNNWFAKPSEIWRRDVETLHALVKSKRVTEIDFNQGLDCRLLTEEIADALKGLPLRPVRFAFDGMQEDGYYQRAVGMMAARGFRLFRNYVLYNFMDTPKDFYYRLREGVRLSEELGVQVESFPMRYQPILNIDEGRNFVGRHWDTKKRAGFMSIMGQHSGVGVLAPKGKYDLTKMQEFEFWFGKTGDEFESLLSYPALRDLLERKHGALRMYRMGEKVNGLVTAP